jgi:hypothetical protein
MFKVRYAYVDEEQPYINHHVSALDPLAYVSPDG